MTIPLKSLCVAAHCRVWRSSDLKIRINPCIGGINRIMKSINQTGITSLILVSCVCVTLGVCVAFFKRSSAGGNVRVKTSARQVKWFDDFLGVNLHPGYAVSLSGSGNVKMSSSSSIGGVVALSTSSEPGVARLRFGEDPATGLYDVRNFSAEKNMTYKARVLLNTNTNVQATVGLIGLHDPEHVIAAVYNAEPGDTNAYWWFEVSNGADHAAAFTRFQHTPDTWFTVKIVTEWGNTPSARIYINDATEPSASVTGAYVPNTGVCPEFQIWNKQMPSGWSQSSLSVDYLSVRQDR